MGHARAGRVGELDRRRADPAGAAVDQQALAAAQSRLGEDRVVGGGEDLRQASGARPVETLGDCHQDALVGRHELGLGARGDNA